MNRYENTKGMLSDIHKFMYESLLDLENSSFGAQLLNGFSDSIENPGRKKEEDIAHLIDKVIVPEIRRVRVNSKESGSLIASYWDELRSASLKADFGWIPFELHPPKKDIVEKFNSTLVEKLSKWACIKPSDSESSTGSAKLIRDYEIIGFFNMISERFRQKGFSSTLPCADDFAFTKGFSQRILQPALGEEAIKALLWGFDIKTNGFDQSELSIFELSDFDIQGAPIYIDAKNWSESTLSEFDSDFKHWSAEERDNHSFKSIKEKLEKIRLVDPGAKYVVINFRASYDAPLKAFDINFNPTSVENAEILLVGAAINDSRMEITEGMMNLIHLIKGNKNNDQ